MEVKIESAAARREDAETPSLRIDKGVPIPERWGANTKKGRPWRQLQIGDSFFEPGGKHPAMAACAKVHQSRGLGKFVVRTVTEEGVRGVRVWRVE